MKKLFALLLTLAMTLSLAACGNKADPAPEEPTTPAEDAQTPEAPAEKEAGWWKEELQTVADGKLTVATSPDFAPYEFYAIDESGTPQLAGFEMALAQYIADYTGLELEVVPMDFDGTITELQTKSVDLGMAGYSPKPERANAMDFSDVFYTGGQSFVTTKANADKFAALEDANKAEYSIGAQTGSIQLDLANTHTPDADIISLPKVTDIISDLLAGNLEGAFIETVVAESYAQNYPDLAVVLKVPYEQEGSVVGVSKGNEALLAAVNEAVAAALADGSMDKFVTEANELASGNTASLVDGEIVAD